MHSAASLADHLDLALAGALLAVESAPDLTVVLVGDQSSLEKLLAARESKARDRSRSSTRPMPWA